ncbi:phenylethanolamine N-methyltransferase-like isoform X3 [Pecten maximus]|uniref:phenylethanolamine N-methyltransferase-like isoform X3 n=1 Tax=Pecten maximus TaxID=6579 RepID=UPI0014586EBD|nr:phenylethanolamine N-methyltransferase-like isoform X3 [Pecten maximus]
MRSSTQVLLKAAVYSTSGQVRQYIPSLVPAAMLMTYISPTSLHKIGKVLTDWWKSDKTSVENVTEYILMKENSSETVTDRHNTMKEKVRDVLSIDVNLSEPLGTGCDVTHFDIITSSLCLEAAAQTLDQYRSNAANVSSLLKSGGHLILNGVLGQSWYRVGEAKFACVSLTREDIESIFVSCGFDIVSMETVMSQEGGYYSDFQGYFIMHANKN